MPMQEALQHLRRGSEEWNRHPGRKSGHERAGSAIPAGLNESGAADGAPPPFSPGERKMKNFRNGCCSSWNDELGFSRPPQGRHT